MMPTDTKCPLPWIHTSIHTTGRVRSCCIAKEEIENNGELLNVIEHSFSDIIHSSSMRDIRGQMRMGKKHPNCSTCWIDEKNGKVSKRMYETKALEVIHGKVNYDKEPTVFKDIQLGVGNICNLKCRTCSPFCSTKWIKEYKDSTGQDSVTFNNLTKNKQTIGSKFWEDFEEWSMTVGRLEIMGGEPFFMKEFEVLIDRLIANGSSKNITISMSSNGTIFNGPLVEKIVNNFEFLGIQFSIDGFSQEHFNYLRHGDDWKNVKSNLKKFYYLQQTHPRFIMGMTITLSQINMFYIREMHQEIEQFTRDSKKEFKIFNNVVHYPSYYSSNCIPTEIKDQYLDKIKNPTNYGLDAWDPDKFTTEIQPLINQVMSNSKESDWAAFVKETNRADEYRGESFSETFPELWKLFEPHWNA
jgi:MoaA/NifB/PqqE/SkfB family radical SAM enzyme